MKEFTRLATNKEHTGMWYNAYQKSLICPSHIEKIQKCKEMLYALYLYNSHNRKKKKHALGFQAKPTTYDPSATPIRKLCKVLIISGNSNIFKLTKL